ncbi:hypothetical protein NM208_g885 [Fusarium decemcellulare]|uniref:Uncharacterized protein n=2 Tax=Fusarium decemcellulare TaxID=57161 RepID=A0ACC1SQM2_9HYPO|nr:hypothetical protein NM208_g3035 [Fusarium decemcellulare]KAJ3548698.1 hypothetical protein NM208_g885 [Fusarium decemcellulare]
MRLKFAPVLIVAALAIIPPCEADWWKKFFRDLAGPNAFHQIKGGREKGYPCEANDIRNFNVGNHCKCVDTHIGMCDGHFCHVCDKPTFKQLQDNRCTRGGCTDNDMTCVACKLYYNRVCNCIQHKNCLVSGPMVRDSGESVWIGVVPPNKNYTTFVATFPLAGIKEMVSKKHRRFSDRGFVWAQTQYNPETQALIIDSFRARQHEQANIMRCEVNPKARELLSREQPPKRIDKLTRISQDIDLWCVAPQSPSANYRVPEFATLIGDLMSEKHPGVCNKLVGGAIIRDNRNITWACASVNPDGPVGKFCSDEFVP